LVSLRVRKSGENVRQTSSAAISMFGGTSTTGSTSFYRAARMTTGMFFLVYLYIQFTNIINEILL
jgi:hypothetical protein